MTRDDLVPLLPLVLPPTASVPLFRRLGPPPDAAPAPLDDGQMGACARGVPELIRRAADTEAQCTAAS